MSVSFKYTPKFEAAMGVLGKTLKVLVVAVTAATEGIVNVVKLPTVASEALIKLHWPEVSEENPDAPLILSVPASVAFLTPRI